MRALYSKLDKPFAYRLARRVFAPGGQAFYTGKIQELLAGLPPADRLLDAGCGPSSRLAEVGLYPTGVDLTPSYVRAYLQGGGQALVGSADQLPFADSQFGGVWSFALFHHLPDMTAASVLKELVRVCKPGGYVVVFDAVLPHHRWQRPLAALIRVLDRGKFMRKQTAFEALFPVRQQWTIRRYTYTKTGLEMVICVLVK